jgi:hypothetical protein
LLQLAVPFDEKEHEQGAEQFKIFVAWHAPVEVHVPETTQPEGS